MAQQQKRQAHALDKVDPIWARVRDIARAEERGSIAAKGIRRGVRVFPVDGILDDRDPEPGVGP